MVNVHIRKDDEWIHALAIPLEDVRRLSLRPLKWLRFVTFTVLGAKGHLSDTPGGNIVDYENVSLADLAADGNYYFTPEGGYHPTDFEGLNDQITTSSITERRVDFRDDVSKRDGGGCVFSAMSSAECDACHIIPRCKGDEYIHFVVSDRSVLYEDQQFPPGDNININSTQNGIFLMKLLHTTLGNGKDAFLKTPNFALNPVDIPRVGIGATPTSRTTLQHIVPLDGLLSIPQWDVRADWSSPLAPPSILLDYIYGVAAVKRWAANDMKSTLKEHHKAVFEKISPLPRSPPTSSDEDDVEPDDATDADCVPPGARRRYGTRHKSKQSELSQAMDVAFQFSMFFKGYPPGTTVAMMRRKQEEEAELRSRHAGRETVQRWLEANEVAVAAYDTPTSEDCGGSLHNVCEE